jgi:CheY-like chemotaxis protein
VLRFYWQQLVQRHSRLGLELHSEGAITNQSFVRVLVVDDFAPWRDYILAKLREDRSLQVIDVAAHGSEAVVKAAELHPDLILMDISLPELSGIKAAAKIRELSPESKILFVSQNLDLEVVRAALGVGGLGYVVKSDAELDLLTAIESVMSGKRFVSGLLASHDFAGVLGPQAPMQGDEGHVDLSAWRLMQKKTLGHSHEVEFYSKEASFLARCTRFIGAALANGDATIVILTSSHRKSLRQRLESEGCHVGEAIERGRYFALEPADVFSKLLEDGKLDADRFLRAAGDLIATALNSATGKHPRVAVCGECAALLHAAGKTEDAVEMEQLWNELARIYNVDSLCGYPIEGFRNEEQGPILQRICAEHTAIYSE